MMTEQQKQEILERIRALPPHQAAMMAARAAMRVVPVLARLWQQRSVANQWLHFDDGGKNIVPEKTVSIMFTVFHACQCIHAAHTAAYAAHTYAADPATAQAAAHATACADAARVSAFLYTYNRDDPAAALAVDAATRAADADADAAAKAVNAACQAYAFAYPWAYFIAADIADAFYDAISWDLEHLVVTEGANQPLWPTAIPAMLQAHWSELQIRLLQLDAGFQFWVDWYEARLQGDKLDWDRIKDQIFLSKEILAQEPEAINTYLLKLARRQAVRPLNRVRVILLGPGEAGKTSLLRALHGEPVVEGREDKTVGIEIREAMWQAKQNRYTPAPENSPDTVVHFWDFGGQVMYHATHQFFLRSNCVYLIVLDGRRAAAGGSEADYWLEHVRAFAPEAPVLLVGNKADQGPMDWEQNRLRNKYPNIRPGGFYQLACTDPANPRYDFAKLKADLRDALEQVGMVQHKFTEAEFAVLAELRRRSPVETFLAKANYQGICDTHGLAVADGQDPRATLLDLLDKLGVVIHFPKIAELDDFLLNPRWLTYGVYQILERQQPRVAKGQVYQWLANTEVLDNLENRLEYPQQRCGFLLEAMESFKVAYRLPHADEPTFVIPSLLPSDEPAELDFPEREARAFRFRFDGLLPPQLLPQLIVARHTDIERKTVWRHGVLLSSPAQGGARALLRGDAYDRTLTLRITGKGLEHYFAVLYQQVRDILQTMPKLPCEELIRLPASARLAGQEFDPRETEPWARWDNVLCAWLDGETVYREKGVRYDLAAVLNIMAEKDRLSWAQRHTSGMVYNDYRGIKMGDNIHISGGQVGAAGSQAKAEHNTLQQQINPTAQQATVAMATLVQELTQLFSAMKDAAAAPEHYEALAAVARAQDAAGKQDAPAALQHLQSAGRWALGIASEIGVSLAAEYLKQGL